mmetsp:Transcript_30811/g.50892  ORF Transcript_30811/g.50892 Transcript_30811/m.50892 type:complete len:104 (+) Transcript_30811:95-406(+)
MLRSIVVSTLLVIPSWTTKAFTPEVARQSFRVSSSRLSSVQSSRITAQLVGLFNDQVTKELEASQLYLSASIWCDNEDLVGMSAYMSACYVVFSHFVICHHFS